MPPGFTSVQPLAHEHELDEFDCGTRALDHWLRTWARHSQREGSARTFVICPAGTRRVVGFHSLTAAAAGREAAPRRIARPLSPNLPVPLVLLARLAVDGSAQGLGLGKALMLDAFSRTVRSAEEIGAVAMMVHAKDGDARAFYEHWGFLPSPLHPLQLFLPLKTIRAAIVKAAGDEAGGLAAGA
jgi:GNAT superfamily N-acetyltransferase